MNRISAQQANIETVFAMVQIEMLSRDVVSALVSTEVSQKTGTKIAYGCAVNKAVPVMSRKMADKESLSSLALLNERASLLL